LEGTVRFLNAKVPALLRRGLPAPPEVGLVVVQAAPVTPSTIVVAVDVGKNEFAVSVTTPHGQCCSSLGWGVR
jgi:hypothetical protein